VTAPLLLAARRSRGASGAALLLAAVAALAGCAGRLPGEAGDGRIVEQALRDEHGLRFGTDGTVGSLYEYVRENHELVPPSHAVRGDVLFFSIAGQGCADHAGYVEEVEDSGRVVFREARLGGVRRSYLHPEEPSVRRAPDGRILNSFLRARRMEDPPTARYHAGELLCAVGRIKR